VDSLSESTHKKNLTNLDPSVLFGIIGEKSRLEILRLCLSEEVSTEELLFKTKLEKTLLSKHLRVLRDANVLISRRQGRRVSYRINPQIKKENLPSGISFHCCEIQLHDSVLVR
jgi:DNA-binding transcriptional ArsR family regulator